MLISLWLIYTYNQLTEDTYTNNTENLYAVEKTDFQVKEEIDYKFEKKNPISNFVCDGREYCSQMTSCEEATYFINYCPHTKMDGNNDGVPCEKQWCKK